MKRTLMHTRVSGFFVGLLLGLLLLVTGCNNQEPTPTPPAATPASVAPADNTTPVAVDNAAGSGTAVAQPTATAAPATPTPEPVGTLTLWHSWAEADGDALAAILAAFAQQYPEIKVNTLFVAYNDLPQAYADAVQAQAGPDLILAPNWWLGEMVAAGVVQDLDELVDAATVDSFWPATVANLRWQGKLYGLPTNFELVSLFYNRDLVAANALPATTDDLLTLAKAAPTQGIGLYATLYHLYWGLPAYGAALLDENGLAVLDQGTGAADYLSWLAALDDAPGTFVDSDYGMLLDRFKKGEFAFLVDGPWSIGELRAALGERLGVTTLPAGPAGPAQPWLSADGVMLNPSLTGQQQWLALLLARHFTSVASAEQLATLANRLPANRTVELGDPLLQGFLAQGANAQPMPMLPEMSQVWGYGGDLLIRVLDGAEDPSDVVATTSTLINEANGK